MVLAYTPKAVNSLKGSPGISTLQCKCQRRHFEIIFEVPEATNFRCLRNSNSKHYSIYNNDLSVVDVEVPAEFAGRQTITSLTYCSAMSTVLLSYVTLIE